MSHLGEGECFCDCSSLKEMRAAGVRLPGRGWGTEDSQRLCPLLISQHAHKDFSKAKAWGWELRVSARVLLPAYLGRETKMLCKEPLSLPCHCWLQDLRVTVRTLALVIWWQALQKGSLQLQPWEPMPSGGCRGERAQLLLWSVACPGPILEIRALRDLSHSVPAHPPESTCLLIPTSHICPSKALISFLH